MEAASRLTVPRSSGIRRERRAGSESPLSARRIVPATEAITCLIAFIRQVTIAGSMPLYAAPSGPGAAFRPDGSPTATGNGGPGAAPVVLRAAVLPDPTVRGPTSAAAPAGDFGGGSTRPRPTGRSGPSGRR